MKIRSLLLTVLCVGIVAQHYARASEKDPSSSSSDTTSMRAPSPRMFNVLSVVVDGTSLQGLYRYANKEGAFMDDTYMFSLDLSKAENLTVTAEAWGTYNGDQHKVTLQCKEPLCTEFSAVITEKETDALVSRLSGRYSEVPGDSAGLLKFKPAVDLMNELGSLDLNATNTQFVISQQIAVSIVDSNEIAHPEFAAIKVSDISEARSSIILTLTKKATAASAKVGSASDYFGFLAAMTNSSDGFDIRTSGLKMSDDSIKFADAVLGALFN